MYYDKRQPENMGRLQMCIHAVNVLTTALALDPVNWPIPNNKTLDTIQPI